MWMWGPDGGWGWIGMGFGMLVWIVIVALIVWVAVRLLSRPPAGPPYGPPPSGPSPADVLRTRYARGEIDEEEYRRRLAVLGESAPGDRG